LDVEGFGAEIVFNQIPSEVMIATNPAGTRRGLRKADYNHFGTRHRSMMRYCARVPGSVGFVVSQDGDVRIMTAHKKRVVIWENVRLKMDTLGAT
jgi:hypothetical protein